MAVKVYVISSEMIDPYDMVMFIEDVIRSNYRREDHTGDILMVRFDELDTYAEWFDALKEMEEGRNIIIITVNGDMEADSIAIAYKPHVDINRMFDKQGNTLLLFGVIKLELSGDYKSVDDYKKAVDEVYEVEPYVRE